MKAKPYMPEPLIDKERESIAILTLIDPETASESERQVRRWIMGYEATINERDARIAALGAELARWQPVIETAKRFVHYADNHDIALGVVGHGALEVNDLMDALCIAVEQAEKGE